MVPDVSERHASRNKLKNNSLLERETSGLCFTGRLSSNILIIIKSMSFCGWKWTSCNRKPVALGLVQACLTPSYIMPTRTMYYCRHTTTEEIGHCEFSNGIYVCSRTSMDTYDQMHEFLKCYHQLSLDSLPYIVG